jgi:hypothetical protein
LVGGKSVKIINKRIFSLSIILICLIGILPIVSARLLYIGPTEEANVKIIESVAVDSHTLDTPSTSLGVVSGDKYTFVKIDLSQLPPIDQIYIVSAYLGFRFSGWHGRGEWGYASIATHYCEDDSWSSSTLTWKNKPDYRKQSTDTWGFSFIYYGPPSLGFDIVEDVEETLRAGDTVLTEVVTWGSGTGSTDLSSPSIHIEYAKRPVYTVLVEAISDDPEVDIVEKDIAKVEVSNRRLYTWKEGKKSMDFCAAPGTYSLDFTGRCKFIDWETGGGVSVSNPNIPSTDIKINADGNLKVKCSLDWILYGDEEKSYIPPPGSGWGLTHLRGLQRNI